MKLVIDASVAVAAALNPAGFERFRRFELVAPPLLWIEAVSSLHGATGPVDVPSRYRGLTVRVKQAHGAINAVTRLDQVV